MCCGVKRNDDDDDRIKGDLFWHCYGLVTKPLMLRIALSHNNLEAISLRNFSKKRFKRNCLQKCIEEIANMARITNSTRIKSCSKNLLANFRLIIAIV